jgi:hypothetical protein
MRGFLLVHWHARNLGHEGSGLTREDRVDSPRRVVQQLEAPGREERAHATGVLHKHGNHSRRIGVRPCEARSRQVALHALPKSGAVGAFLREDIGIVFDDRAHVVKCLTAHFKTPCVRRIRTLPSVCNINYNKDN